MQFSMQSLVAFQLSSTNVLPKWEQQGVVFIRGILIFLGSGVNITHEECTARPHVNMLTSFQETLEAELGEHCSHSISWPVTYFTLIDNSCTF